MKGDTFLRVALNEQAADSNIWGLLSDGIFDNIVCIDAVYVIVTE